jgi:alpha-glucosidase
MPRVSVARRWLPAALLLVAQPAVAAWTALGPVERTELAGDRLDLLTASGARVRIVFPAADAVRIRVAPSGTFARDFSYAVAAPSSALPLVVEAPDAMGTIALHARAADALRVVVVERPNLALEIRDADGGLVVADDPARPTAFDPATGAIETAKQRAATELYYGFGEKALPLSRHQQYLTMWNSDTPGYGAGVDPLYQSIPFFIALHAGRSYGLFLDHPGRSHFDMGKTDPARYTFGVAGGELDYTVFGGGRAHRPREVLRAYTARTGRGPLPPLWALGYQQSRYSYTPDAKVREIARTFRERRIPADVIYFDIGYMDGYRIFTWSPTDFPDPRGLLVELHAQGFHAVTIVDPGIKQDEGYAIYRDGRARGAFVRTARGEELDALVWPGRCAFPDFTDAAARAWFGSLYAGFIAQGVDGFWNDMNEPATFVPPETAGPVLLHDPRKTFPADAPLAGDGDPGPHARYHNVYGMQMARATFEGVQRLRPARRPFVLTRAGYAGIQRYAAVWTGDNAATWEDLALSLPMLTNLSVSGVPLVGADVGGFVGSPDGELYARWLQAAALTPFLRTHSAIDTEPREPWSFGAEITDIDRATIELRYRLLPYLYTLFADQAARGDPVLRPLWFEYPDDTRGLLVDDEFLLGGDLLVAPVLREHARARRVYFPAGADWFDWWDGTRHAGGSDAEVSAPLDRLPLFLRAGAAIPVQPVVQHTGEMARVPPILVVAPGADGEGEIYQDAGDGYAYLHGEARRTELRVRDGRVRLESRGADRFPHVAAVEFVGVEAPTAVRVDGRNVRGVAFDAARRRLRVPLPPTGAREIVLRR